MINPWMLLGENAQQFARAVEEFEHAKQRLEIAQVDLDDARAEVVNLVDKFSIATPAEIVINDRLVRIEESCGVRFVASNVMRIAGKAK